MNYESTIQVKNRPSALDSIGKYLNSDRLDNGAVCQSVLEVV